MSGFLFNCCQQGGKQQIREHISINVDKLIFEMGASIDVTVIFLA